MTALADLRGRRLNRRVTLQEPVYTDNSRGGRATSWSTIGELWAELIPLRGNTALEQLVNTDTQTWKVTVRWREGLTGEHRFLFGARVLEIVGQPEDPDGKRAELVMTCLERRAGAG